MLNQFGALRSLRLKLDLMRSPFKIYYDNTTVHVGKMNTVNTNGYMASTRQDWYRDHPDSEQILYNPFSFENKINIYRNEIHLIFKNLKV